jgi:hypothetical protein
MSEEGREPVEARRTAGDLYDLSRRTTRAVSVARGKRCGHVIAAGRTHRNYRAVRAGVARAPRRE